MIFYLADSLDTVDADYDFVGEKRRTLNRQAQDVYAHELFTEPPYDGILISRAKIEGKHSRFSPGQRYRLLRNGIHAFLRVPDDFPTMIDCGAYSHLGSTVLQYDVEDCVDFYSQCQFGAGVSPDCVILELNPSWDDPRRTPASVLGRAEATHDAARRFLRACRAAGMPFDPVGVVQAWSPQSATKYAKGLVESGYTWIGLGGLAHRRTDEIYDVLCEVRSAIPEEVRLHLFGFNRIDQLDDFSGLGISSIDSSAPLLKAVKDDRHNYFCSRGAHHLAIKITSRHEGRVRNQVASGAIDQDIYAALEEGALEAFRECACGRLPVERALDRLRDYHEFAFPNEEFPAVAYCRILREQPWKECECEVCKEIGPEIVLLRGINRNKRRAFHNSFVFHRKVKRMDAQSVVRFPAIRFQQSNGCELFQFVAQARDLARFTTVSRLTRNADGTLSGYQRPEVEYHIREISEYLERSDAMLPNAIIISMRESPGFDSLRQSGECGELGVLTIDTSQEGNKALIVDGQQRSAAFRRLTKASFPVPVLAFVADGNAVELQQFLLVNNTKPLPQSLVHELLPALGKAIPVRLGLRQEACAVVEKLTSNPESPFKDRVRTMTRRHLSSANISDTAVIRMVENSMRNGLLFSLSTRGDTGLTQLRRFWQAVSREYPEAWQLPPRKSRLTHGAGIAALGFLMDTIFDLLTPEVGLPTVEHYAQEVARIGDLPWTEGVWHFSHEMVLPWNEIQNTSRHRELLSNHLVRMYLQTRRALDAR